MTEQADSVSQFFFRGLEELGIPAEPLDGGRFLLRIPPGHREELGCGESLPITFDKEVFQKSDESALEYITPGSPVLSWLVSEIRKLGTVSSARLSVEASSPDRLRQEILSRYQVDGGTVETVGLNLRDSFSVQFDYAVRIEGLETREKLVRLVLDERGEAVPDHMAAAMDRAPVVESSGLPPVSNGAIEDLTAKAGKLMEEIRRKEEAEATAVLESKRAQEARQLNDYFSRMREDLKETVQAAKAEDRSSAREQLDSVDRQFNQRLAEMEDRYRVSSTIRPVGALILSHPIAEGKVEFRCGDRKNGLDLRLPAYAPVPPPFKCQKTGAGVYRITATADGRFVDSSITGVCAESGYRMPKDELVQCSSTGQLFLPQYVLECPLMLKPVSRRVAVVCTECLQAVSPVMARGAVCWACANRKMTHPSDRRIQELMARYPKLRSWTDWWIGETRDICTVQLQGTISMARLVFRKSDLAVIVTWKRNRFLGDWRQTNPAELV